MSGPKFKGDDTFRVSRTLTNTKEKVEQTEVFQGSLDKLTSLNYTVGQPLSALAGSSALYIVSVTYETHANGPFASLTVKASSNAIPENSSGDEEKTNYELDFQRIEKELRTHRAFQAGGQYALTEDDLNKIAGWERESDGDKRKTLYNALSASAKQCAKRLARGQTSYPIWVPVARKSYYTSTRPSTSDVGAIDNPPSQCAAPKNTSTGKSYIYVRTSDKATREQGSPWRREIEWMGFDEVDNLIYKNE